MVVLPVAATLLRDFLAKRLPAHVATAVRDGFHPKCTEVTTFIGTCVENGSNDRHLLPFVHDRLQVGPDSAIKSGEKNSVAKATDID